MKYVLSMGLDQLPYVLHTVVHTCYGIQHRYLIVKSIKLSYVYQKIHNCGDWFYYGGMKFGRILRH